MSATVRQCVILVGGLGTRLGALSESLPKPLMPCGDRPFLAWLMREMQRYGVESFVLLAGHLSARIEQAVDELHRHLPKPARIVLSIEPFRAGTGGALHHARPHLEDRFLLCNGDSLFDCNLATLLARAAAEPDAFGWMVLRHLEATGRYGVVSLAADGTRIDGFSSAGRPAEPGHINAGIYLFRPDLLDHLSPSCSLEQDVLPGLAAAGMLRGVVEQGYFRDIGVPEDLALAQVEIPQRLHRPALLLDRDGVINHDHGWVGTRERFEWTPDGREAIRVATSSRRHVFVVTNQSGVARGHYDEAQMHALHDWMMDEIRARGGTVDDIRACPYHEDATVPRYRRRSDWRKPEPGMLLDLVRAWELDPARCTMIGDQPTDMMAAEAAGIAGHLTRGGDLLALLAGMGMTP